MTPEDNTKLEVLASHYDSTFEQILSTVKRRDRLFGWIIAIVVLMLIELVAPDDVDQVATSLLQERLGLTQSPNMALYSSVIWFILLGLSIRYFQAVIHARRLYDYIHQLEDSLSQLLPTPAFTREGSRYLADYPIFSKWVSIVYGAVSPLMLMVITTVKIVAEFRHISWTWNFAFDLTVYLALMVSTILYLIHGFREK